MSDESEENGTGNGQPTFDHTELETLGRAFADTGRGLVRFGSGYPYAETAEREILRQRLGRFVALINALWPRMDAAIKADKRPPITSHERDAHLYHVDRLFRLMEAATKDPKKDD